MIIALEHVSVAYPNASKNALTDLSCAVERGEFCILRGPSGSGKTTLLRLLSGELRASVGSIQVAGFDLRTRKPSAGGSAPNLTRYRQSVGFVFQDFRLLADKTIFENIAFALEIMPRQGRHDLTARVDRVLERLELEHVRDAFPREVSHGEQARVAIARAVVREPYVLVADEPTAQLDQKASTEIVDLIRGEHRRGMTVLLLTSDESISFPGASVCTLAACLEVPKHRGESLILNGDVII